MKRAIVFIDGSNFYHRLKYLTKNFNVSLLDFNYRKFCEWLCRGFEIIDARYYVGVVRIRKNNTKSKEMHSNQQRLFKRLHKYKIKLVEGQLIQHPDGIYHEKGVDVRIAVEMIRFARQNLYDTAFLLSSDNDLIPAIEEVKLLNKKVRYICAIDRRSYGLSKIAGDFFILRENSIINFFKK